MDSITQITDWLKILGGGSNSAFTLVNTISVIAGFLTLFIAFIRLTKHGKAQKMFRYYAPSTTFFMFFSGVMLISMSGFVQMVVATIFPDAHMDNINQISSYIQSINNDPDNVPMAQQYLVFALLNVVGFISLIRGTFLMINMSEGQREGNVPQIISHMVAGVIGMNAEFFLNIFGNLYATTNVFIH